MPIGTQLRSIQLLTRINITIFFMAENLLLVFNV